MDTKKLRQKILDLAIRGKLVPQDPNDGSEQVKISRMKQKGGTGDMNEAEFLLAYRMNAIMGGDIIPRRPPIWACSCGCKRFRKVYFDGTDVPVKVKMLKNISPKPLTLIDFESTAVERALLGNHHEVIHHYKVDIVTELGEKETLSITAVSGSDAEDTAREIVAKGVIGLMGTKCEQLELFDN